jgi:hypothetical protein
MKKPEIESLVRLSISGYRDEMSPYVTSTYVSSPYDTSTYVISRCFYGPVPFIPEVWGPYSGLGLVRLNAQPIQGWWSSVGCDSFRDETFGDVKTLGNNVRGRNIRGLIVPVLLLYFALKFECFKVESLCCVIFCIIIPYCSLLEFYAFTLLENLIFLCEKHIQIFQN